MNTRVCARCGERLPVGDLARRTGQPYFVARDGRAWPAEPLLDKVVEETCNNCYALYVLREMRV